MNNFWPIQSHQTDLTVGTVSSYFGKRPNPLTSKIETHKGIDIVAPIGWSIHAPESGLVVTARDWVHDVYGKFVVIKTDSNYRLNLWHMNEVFVANGEYINAGQVIGTVGDTGNTTGAHLHFQCCMANSPHGVAFDPLNAYFDVFARLTGRKVEPLKFRAIKAELDECRARLDTALGFINNIGG